MSKRVIFLNGKARQVSPGCRIPELLEEFGLKASSIMVERNGEALLRSALPEVELEHGDRLELIRIVAGG